MRKTFRAGFPVRSPARQGVRTGALRCDPFSSDMRLSYPSHKEAWKDHERGSGRPHDALAPTNRKQGRDQALTPLLQRTDGCVQSRPAVRKSLLAQRGQAGGTEGAPEAVRITASETIIDRTLTRALSAVSRGATNQR